MKESFLARAPSNIALVKYMGKAVVEGNIPANPSLSLTLNRLCSVAVLETLEDSREASAGGEELKVEWSESLEIPNQEYQFYESEISTSGIEKVLRHTKFVATEVSKYLADKKIATRALGRAALRCKNTFPAGAGIASSASSFAAVTLVTARGCFRNQSDFDEVSKNPEFSQFLASLSRHGSGSSCRSFHGPLVEWSGENVQPVAPGTIPPLCNLVLVLSSREKSVSSSEAHQRVQTSPLWNGRSVRAARRVECVKDAVENGDWNSLAKTVWDEFWEMHSLFHTSDPPFSYWEPESLAILKWISAFNGDTKELRPIVTMDAGPNIHVLITEVQRELWKKRVNAQFPQIAILEDTSGPGAKLLTK